MSINSNNRFVEATSNYDEQFVMRVNNYYL